MICYKIQTIRVMTKLFKTSNRQCILSHLLAFEADTINALDGDSKYTRPFNLLPFSMACKRAVKSFKWFLALCILI